MSQPPREADATADARQDKPIRVVVLGAGSAASIARMALQRKLGGLVHVVEESALCEEAFVKPGSGEAPKSNRACDLFNIISRDDLDDISLSLCATSDNKPDRPAWVSPYGPGRGGNQRVYSASKSKHKR